MIYQFTKTVKYAIINLYPSLKTSLEISEQTKVVPTPIPTCQEDPLSNLISEFTSLTLNKSKKLNKTFRSLTKNSHGFLQRTIYKKSDSSSRNLQKILYDLYEIYIENYQTEQKNNAQTRNRKESKEQTLENKCESEVSRTDLAARGEDWCRSLNLSMMKEEGSFLGSASVHRDNFSLKLGYLLFKLFLNILYRKL